MLNVKMGYYYFSQFILLADTQTFGIRDLNDCLLLDLE